MMEYNDFVSIYWCGFNEEFCGISNTNDVSKYASHVIIAFLNIE